MRTALRIGLWVLVLAGVVGLAAAAVGLTGGASLVGGKRNDGWAALGGLYLLVAATAVGVWGITTLTIAAAGLVLARKRPGVLIPLSLLALFPTVALGFAVLPFVLRGQRLSSRHEATLARHVSEMKERGDRLSACLAAPSDPTTLVNVATSMPLPELDRAVRAGAPGHRLATPRELACAFQVLVPAELRGPDAVLLAQAGDLDGDGKPDHLVAVTAHSEGALAIALLKDDGKVTVFEPERGRSRVLLGLAAQEPPKPGGGPRFFDAQGPIVVQEGWPIDDPRFFPRTILDDGRFQPGAGRTMFVATPREVTVLPHLPR